MTSCQDVQNKKATRRWPSRKVKQIPCLTHGGEGAGFGGPAAGVGHIC